MSFDGSLCEWSIEICKVLNRIHGQAVRVSSTTHCFAGARLSTGHQVSAGADDGNAVLLHWGRLLVLGFGDVVLDGLAQVINVEATDAVGRVPT